MHFPRFMRRVNRAVTNPVLGTIAWIVPPMAVLHHRGRKSGRRYHTPVIAFRTKKGFVVPMTYGRDVDWARNIVAGKGCQIVQLGQRHELGHPRVVGTTQAYPHLPAGFRRVLRAANLPGYLLLEQASEKPAGEARPARRTH